MVAVLPLGPGAGCAAVHHWTSLLDVAGCSWILSDVDGCCWMSLYVVGLVVSLCIIGYPAASNDSQDSQRRQAASSGMQRQRPTTTQCITPCCRILLQAPWGCLLAAANGADNWATGLRWLLVGLAGNGCRWMPLDAVGGTTSNGAQPRPTAPNHVQQRPTTSNSVQPHPTAPNHIQQRPTMSNSAQARPTAPNHVQQHSNTSNSAQPRPKAPNHV